MVIKRTSDLPIYIMIGLPGSGKSTWIEKNLPRTTPIVSRDVIRAELGFCDYGEKVVLSREEEQEVTKEETKQVKYYISKKIPFVIDDTNISRFSETFIKSLRKYGKVHLIGVVLNTPLSVCKQRREGQIPPEALDRLYLQMQSIDLDIYDEVIEVN